MQVISDTDKDSVLPLYQLNGHPSFIIDQIPDTFTQNGIYYRSYLVLSAPNGIEVSHCSESVRNRLMLYFNSSKSMN